jgi:hypothetical protein
MRAVTIEFLLRQNSGKILAKFWQNSGKQNSGKIPAKALI